jgi:hypothetical protein
VDTIFCCVIICQIILMSYLRKIVDCVLYFVLLLCLFF